MKIEQTAAQGKPVVKPASQAGKPNPPAANAPETAAADSVALSSQAQTLLEQDNTQETTLLDSAKNLIASNPTKARSQLETIIAQSPDSSDAQKARQLLAELPQSGE